MSRSTPPSPVTGSPPSLGMTVQASSLLLCSLIAAAASTVTVGIVALIQANAGSGPDDPTPPSQTPLIICAAIFVVSWIAVAFSFCRDQVLHRVGQMETSVASVAAVQLELRSEFAALRREMTEYAEQRETEGYLNGRRAADPSLNAGNGSTAGNGAAADRAAAADDTLGEVRHLRRVPPAP